MNARRDPRTERHTALQLAGEHELRRLDTAWPSSVGALPAHRRISAGRTHSRSWNPADMDPVQGYTRRGNGRIRSVLLVCAIGAGLTAVMFFGSNL